jgi:hypothetical protein
MRVKTYPILVQCIENGVVCGLRKALKYDLDPDADEDRFAEIIQQYVMNDICEHFDWEDETDDRGAAYSSSEAYDVLHGRLRACEEIIGRIERRLRERGSMVHNHEVVGGETK